MNPEIRKKLLDIKKILDDSAKPTKAEMREINKTIQKMREAGL